MNTKPIPACLALTAGFVICVMSFVQRVDSVVFAKKFVIACIVFFVIGTVIRVVIDINFKGAASEEEGENPAQEDGEMEGFAKEDSKEEGSDAGIE